MGYFDGNTVTALWNYAQHFAMSDNSYGTMFGPSAVGALNLIAGTTATATLFPTKPNGKPRERIGQHRQRFDNRSGDRRPAARRRRMRADKSRLADHQHGLDRGNECGRSAEREKHYVGMVRGRLCSPPAWMQWAARSAARITRASPVMTPSKRSATTFRTTSRFSTTRAPRISITYAAERPVANRDFLGRCESPV